MPDCLIPYGHDGEVLGPADTVRVIGIVHAFAATPIVADRPAGDSVAELIEAVAGGLPAAAHVTLEGPGGEPYVIERALWHRVRPKPGTVLRFRAVPRGGKNAGLLRAILGLVVVVAALFLAPYLVGALLPTLTGSMLTMATSIAAGVITAIGNLALNMLFPVRPPKLSGGSDDSGTPTQSIAATQNRANPWGPVPVVFGRHRTAPVYAAAPYNEIVGDDQFLRLLFCFGYGPLDLEDLRIGESPLSQFEEVEIEIRNGYADDAPITLYPDQVFQQNFDILLEASEEETGPGQEEALTKTWYERRTEPDIDEISLDITFPRGLVRFKTEGDREERAVRYDIEYRAVGAPDWIAFGSFRPERDEPQPVRYGHRWTVARGQYDVRVQRWSRDEKNQRKMDEMRWTALRGIRNEDPVRPDQPLCLVAMRIKATDQLNGTVDTFNAIATSILPDWEPNASPPQWIVRATRNPASHYRAVLQGPANARPAGDGRLDLEGLQAWHEQCTAQGWTFDHIRDGVVSAFDALADIASAGRAAVRYSDGKWGVIVEGWDAPVVAHFTPRNSWGFQAARGYRDYPHGWRVRFINRDKDWGQDERIVYDDGFDAETATRFEGLEFPGVTDPALIWRHARYHLAQLRLRPETYSFNVDFENLLCQRGDRIRLTHDVPLLGRFSGRVAQSYEGGFTVPLDDIVQMEPGPAYCIRFRAADGASLLFNVVAAPGEHRSVTLVDPGGDPQMPEPGDLWMFGEVGRDSAVMRVLGIEPGPDLTALITCVDDAPAIADADSGPIPEFESQVSEPYDLRSRLPPTDLRFTDGLYRAGPQIQSVGTLSWRRPIVTGPVEYEVQYKRSTLEEWLAGGTTGATSWQIVNPDGGQYDFRVRTRAAGQASVWAALTGQAIQGLLGPPQDVARFRVHIVGSAATLSWSPVEDLDLSHYEIRFQPVTVGALWQNALVLADNLVGTSLQTAAMVGTWLIKAVDGSGVYSENAAAIVSSVAALAGLNVVEVLDEAAGSPAFAGTASVESQNVALDAGLLRLDDVDQDVTEDAPAIEGVYAFAQSIDLGEIFTSRLTGTVQVTGIDLEDDVFARADWFGVEDYFGGLIDGYEVELQGRWTSGDPNASPVAWSAWTSFLVMDVTARAFEFRLLLRSFDRNITPLVSALAVQIDMPDRVAAAEDVAVPDTGLAVVFAPAFRATPAVVATVQDGATGDYAEITGKSDEGFTVTVKNAAGVGVARTIDWVAKGYGVRS